MSLSPIRIVVTGALADPLAGKADAADLTAEVSRATTAEADLASDIAGKAGTATATQSTNGLMSAASKLKLDGIDTGATANASNAQLRDRATHTGSQAISTVTGLQTALNDKVSRSAPSITAGFNFSGFTGYNLADAVSDSDAANLGQVIGAVTTGVNTAIAGSFSRSLLATSSLTTAALFRSAIGAPSTAIATTGADGLLSAADKTKLNGVASGATANAADAALRDRATHTGVQAIATITGLQTALDGKASTANVTTSVAGLMSAADKVKINGIDTGATANDTNANLKARANHTGVQAISTVTGLQAALDGKAADTNATTSVAGKMSAADKTKLDGVASGATANAADSALRDRTTHTGVQAISTVSGLQGALDAKAPQTALDAEQAARIAADSGEQAARIAADAGLAAQDSAEQAARISADNALSTRVTAALGTAIQTQGRPGDAIERFTSAITGSGAGGAAPPGVPAINDAMGAVQRVTGAGITALKERIAVSDGDVIRIDYEVQRTTNPTDPAGDTVRFGVNRLNKSLGQVSGGVIVVHDETLAVPVDAQDTFQWSAVWSSSAGPGIDFVWSATTKYLVPLIQTYGLDGVTDLGRITWTDITASFGTAQGLATEEAARIAAVSAEQAARIAGDDAEQAARISADSAEQAARIAGISGEATTRAAADTVLQGNIDAATAALTVTTTDLANEKLRARRVALTGQGLNVEDTETLAIDPFGRRAMGVSLLGALLSIGLDAKWGAGLDGEHRLAIIGDGDLAGFWMNHDGSFGMVADDFTKGQFGGGIGSLDVPRVLFSTDVYGAAYLSDTLIRAWSSEEGQTFSYVYRRDIAPGAAIREGREPFEFMISNGQSLEVGGGANAASPHVLNTNPLKMHLNFMLNDGMRGPGSTAWNPASSTDFAPAVEAYNATKNEGETGQVATARYLSQRQAALGKVAAPFVMRADGRGGTLLADLVKGSVPYANSMAAMRRMGEIACEKYRRPWVVRATPFSQGNADRASATPRQDWVDMLVQYAQDNNDDVLALMAEFAAAYPDLYENVTLPSRVVLLTAQLTDAISSTGDTADDIIFAHVDAAEASDLIFISHPQYFFKDAYGYVDAAHLQALGYCVKGEYHAQAYERAVWNGDLYGGLFPDRPNIVRSGGDIIVPVLGKVGALRINTTDLNAASNAGFVWGGSGAISAVNVVGSTIVLSGTTGGGLLTYGAKHQATAKPAGSYSYGNISDTATADSIAVPGLKLTNWLPAFDKTL